MCDIAIGSIIALPNRNRVADLTFPFLSGPMFLLVSKPDASANFYGILQPFQWQVSDELEYFKRNLKFQLFNLRFGHL